MKYSEILLSAAFIIQLLFSTGANAEAYYTATYGEDYVPPFISKNANAVTGGLIFDLYKIIEEEVGIKIKLVSAPKNRESQLMEKGRVDFTCYASKSWTKNPDKYLWTDDKLFTVVNRVFYNKEKFSKIPTDVNSLIGRSVGTILGYKHHGKMEDLFETRKVKKVETRSFKLLYKSLSSGRIDSIIDTDIQYHYKKKHEKLSMIEPAPILLSTYDIMCQVSKKSPKIISNLNKAIRNLKESGKIDKLIMSYKK